MVIRERGRERERERERAKVCVFIHAPLPSHRSGEPDQGVSVDRRCCMVCHLAWARKLWRRHDAREDQELVDHLHERMMSESIGQSVVRLQGTRRLSNKNCETERAPHRATRTKNTQPDCVIV